MKLNLYVADPAGNITILVTTPVPAEKIPAISNILLKIPRYKAEQVAFLVPAQMGAQGRIQMMGGEFCGNATRSFGYLLSRNLPDKPKTVYVEISGAATPLTVEIDHKNRTAQAQMPLLLKRHIIEFNQKSYSAMEFDGIVHLIVNGKAETDEFVTRLIDKTREIVKSDAYGVMFLSGNNMTPVVYVCETDSLIWEGSCGSGSMAAAAYLALENEKDGTYSYSFTQPGGIITATVTIKNGETRECKMGGPVYISDEIELEIDV